MTTTGTATTGTAGAADPHDVQVVQRADGLLAAFNRAGVLGAADVHVATRLQRVALEDDPTVLLGAALAVRAVRQGSVCVDLATVAETTAVEGVAGPDVAALPWPDPAAWLATMARSRLVSGAESEDDRPLRLVGGLLYLDRYWRQERVIADYVDGAAVRPPAAPDPARLAPALARLFPGDEADQQRLAAVVAAHRRLSIVAGGPGTGKTTTVAKLLALLAAVSDTRVRVALAAPTGKAAARLQEAAAAVELPAEDRARLGTLGASTLHRLLGYRPGSRTRFRHDRDDRLPYDVVVVDEASMVSLTLMSRLVDALRPDCRLVLVGDPDQLASVEVGAVLGDLVERPAPEAVEPLTRLPDADLDALAPGDREAARTRGVVRLSRVFRFDETIESLAEAIRSGRPEQVAEVLRRGHPSLELVPTDASSGAGLDALRRDVLDAGTAMVRAARAGDGAGALAALDRHRLLCAHRDGPYGVERWGDVVQQWLAEELPGYGRDGLWHIGRPLLVTSNDPRLRLYNGDTGVVVEADGRPQAAFRREGEVVLIAPGRLSDTQTMHALSVHRSQGSQFDRVTVLLPPVDSPLLTRELLYTAVTRAQRHVRLVGTSEALALAVRRPVVRASGLRVR